MRAWIVLAFAATGLTGCATHHSLRQNTLSTTATIADLNCQQVLDNVARFVAHPDALPSLAVVNNGSVLVTDQSAVGGAATYSPTLTHLQQIGGFPILSLFFAPTVTHNVVETWSVAPVTDAERLRRIRCAFQFLVLGGIEDGPCNDCQQQLGKFFGGEITGAGGFDLGDAVRLHPVEGGGNVVLRLVAKTPELESEVVVVVDGGNCRHDEQRGNQGKD